MKKKLALSAISIFVLSLSNVIAMPHDISRNNLVIYDRLDLSPYVDAKPISLTYTNIKPFFNKEDTNESYYFKNEGLEVMIHQRHYPYFLKQAFLPSLIKYLDDNYGVVTKSDESRYKDIFNGNHFRIFNQDDCIYSKSNETILPASNFYKLPNLDKWIEVKICKYHVSDVLEVGNEINKMDEVVECKNETSGLCATNKTLYKYKGFSTKTDNVNEYYRNGLETYLYSYDRNYMIANFRHSINFTSEGINEVRLNNPNSFSPFQTEDIVLKTPERDGYLFIGYEVDGVVHKNYSITPSMNNKDLNITLLWEKLDEYLITLPKNVNFDNKNNSLEYIIDKNIMTKNRKLYVEASDITFSEIHAKRSDVIANVMPMSQDNPNRRYHLNGETGKFTISYDLSNLRAGEWKGNVRIKIGVLDETSK